MLPKRTTSPESGASPPPSLTTISKSCFAAMQSKMSLALTMAYHMEEKREIEKTLRAHAKSNLDIENFIAIGCSYLRYSDIAAAHCQTYTAIEPSLEGKFSQGKIDYFKKFRGVTIVPKNFENIDESDLPDKGRRVFFFLFNVFPYIDNAMETLKKLARRGDLVVISGWNNDSADAQKLQKDYYDYLQSAFNCSVTHKGSSAYLDKLEQDTFALAEDSYRVKGKTTDILTMKMK